MGCFDHQSEPNFWEGFFGDSEGGIFQHDIFHLESGCEMSEEIVLDGASILVYHISYLCSYYIIQVH